MSLTIYHSLTKDIVIDVLYEKKREFSWTADARMNFFEVMTANALAPTQNGMGYNCLWKISSKKRFFLYQTFTWLMFPSLCSYLGISAMEEFDSFFIPPCRHRLLELPQLSLTPRRCISRCLSRVVKNPRQNWPVY